MKNSKKMTTRLVLLALLLMITLGYAFLTANLNITGTSKIKDARWNIHFANLSVTDKSVPIGEGDSAAVITSTNTTEVTYAVTLTKPKKNIQLLFFMFRQYLCQKKYLDNYSF